MQIETLFEVYEITYVWEKNFPKGYGHTSISYLKRCHGFEYAKLGDMVSAHSVVQKCVKPNRIRELVESFPNAILIPVIDTNVLPLAFAQRIGLPVWTKVFRTDKTPRKNLFAIQRLSHKPTFAGHIQKGKEYIIVDDIVTQGGTAAALREYILDGGGKVSAIAALAFSIGSYDIAPAKNMLFRLHLKFGFAIYVLQAIGLIHVFEELTHSQIRYLLRFSSVRNICKKLDYVNSLPPPVKKPNTTHSFLKLAESRKQEAAFSDELCCFPMSAKRPTKRAAASNAMTEEQKAVLSQWKNLSRDEQQKTLAALLRNLKH
ncbi:MAG: phosphoribosyltransferase [Defluviitaleaceae bacterium]|nr:phosphoribosyltransferase [Defluviitaleaceae bacterium]MCL2262883.1 phosphoribosyltransferase [Defluviitaleaceae bacterium]